MVFTVNEENRIICLFAIYESPTEVRRRYINEYYIAPRVASTLQLTQFIRVWKRFQERGGLSKFQGQHRKGTGLPGTDFWLWGHLGKIVHGANPRSIDELMQTVEDARNTITPDNIEESLRNLTKRLQSCVAQNGGHFQHLL